MHLKIPDAVYYTRKTMPWNIQVNGNVMFYKEKNKLNGKKTKSCFSFWVARLFLIYAFISNSQLVKQPEPPDLATLPIVERASSKQMNLKTFHLLLF